MNLFPNRPLFTGYAQSGEDALAAFLFEAMGLKHPSYLDIGAHDPVRFSNTYAFHRRGARGVLVEANPLMARRIRSKRPGDVCLNLGVTAAAAGVLPFYVMSPSTLSTFDPEKARRLSAEPGHRIVDTIQVEAMPITDLLAAHAPAPDFVSLDIESDMTGIIAAWPFDQVRPAVLCIETLEYDPARGGMKDEPLIALMEERGYEVYADTHINTLFVDPLRVPFRVGRAARRGGHC